MLILVERRYVYTGGPLLVGITCRECSAQNNPIALVPTGKVQRYPLFSSVFLPHLGGKFSARCQPVIGASKLVDYFGLFSWINCGYLGGMFSAVYVGCSTDQRWTFLLGGTSSGVDVRGLLLHSLTKTTRMDETLFPKSTYTLLYICIWLTAIHLYTCTGFHRCCHNQLCDEDEYPSLPLILLYQKSFDHHRRTQPTVLWSLHYWDHVYDICLAWEVASHLNIIC